MVTTLWYPPLGVALANATTRPRLTCRPARRCEQVQIQRSFGINLQHCEIPGFANAAYDFRHERSRKVLVSSKVAWLGLGAPCHLARMGYLRSLWISSGRCEDVLSTGRFTLGLFRMCLGPELLPVGNLLCQRRAPELAK